MGYLNSIGSWFEKAVDGFIIGTKDFLLTVKGNVTLEATGGSYEHTFPQESGTVALREHQNRTFEYISSTAHGFSVGDVLTIDGSGNYVKVSNPNTEKPVGIVHTVSDVNNFVLCLSGFIGTLSGLTAGTMYYVQASGILGTTVTNLPYLISKSTTGGYILSSGAGNSQAITKTYATIAAMLAAQSEQVINKWYLAQDASDDATVVTGWAIYQYNGTPTADLIDYLKIAEQESLDITINDATESVKGIIELATQSEVNTGTDDLRAVTSLKLKTYADANYIKLTGTSNLAGNITIAGNYDKYFTGTGGFVIGHSALTNANGRLQVRGTGSSTNVMALFEDNAGVERLRIDDSGWVNINNVPTIGVSEKLSVGGNFVIKQGTVNIIDGSNVGKFSIDAVSGGGTIINTTHNSYSFSTNSTQRFALHESYAAISHRLAIGEITWQGDSLYIKGVGTTTNPLIRALDNTGTERFKLLDNGAFTATGPFTITQPASSTTTPSPLMTLTGGAHTNLTAAESVDINFNLARTVQFTGGSTISLQRAFVIQAPTYSTTSAGTITDAATFEVSGAPIAGTNATIPRKWAARLLGDTLVSGNLFVGATGVSSGAKLAVRGSGTGSGNLFYATNSVGAVRFDLRDDGFLTWTSISSGNSFSSTWTAGGDNVYHLEMLGNFTARTQAGDTLNGYRIAPTLIATANNQIFNTLIVDSTTTTGAFTGLTSAIVRLRGSGTDRFVVLDNGTVTNTFTDATTNTTINQLTLERKSSGTAAGNIGTAIRLGVQNSTGTVVYGTFSHHFPTITASSEMGRYTLSTYNGGTLGTVFEAGYVTGNFAGAIITAPVNDITLSLKESGGNTLRFNITNTSGNFNFPSGGSRWYNSSGSEFLRTAGNASSYGGLALNFPGLENTSFTTWTPTTAGPTPTEASLGSYNVDLGNNPRSSATQFVARGQNRVGLVVNLEHANAVGINIVNVASGGAPITNFDSTMLLLGHVAKSAYSLSANSTAPMSKFVRNIGSFSGGFDLTGAMQEYVQTTVTGDFIRAWDGTSNYKFQVKYDGSTGIGVSPTSKLHVKGNGTTTGELFRLDDSASTNRLLILDNGNTTLTGDLTIADAKNLVFNTTTGTKIGTATTQKIGFFNATPVVQPSAVTTSQGIASALSSLGLIATSTVDEVLFANVDISSAQILSGNTSPVTIVPAPGAGKMIQVLAVTSKGIWNSIAYATNISSGLYINGVSSGNIIALDFTADRWKIGNPGTVVDTSANLENQALVWQVITGNPTAGNSTLKIRVAYKIVTF